MKPKKKNLACLSLSVAAIFLIICSPVFLKCESTSKGNIIGFVYDKDGTTPLDGAIVKFLNVATDAVYESSRSDNNGLFKVIGIENGIYIFGVLTPRGDFILDDLIGVKIQAHETAKLSISLMPKEEITSAEQRAPAKVKKNSKQERVIPVNELELQEQTEVLTEEKMALMEFRGIASVNAASSGISFGILTLNSDETVKITCCSPYRHNYNSGNITQWISNLWQLWWSRCRR